MENRTKARAPSMRMVNMDLLLSEQGYYSDDYRRQLSVTLKMPQFTKEHEEGAKERLENLL